GPTASRRRWPARCRSRRPSTHHRGLTGGRRRSLQSPAMDINGAAAIITGGASGLGAATARRLAAAGAEVTLLDLDRQADLAEALAKELGNGAKFVVADVTNPEQIEQAVALAGETKPLRIAVNCAGLGIAMRTIDKSG